MARDSKDTSTDKPKRQAQHIAEDHQARGAAKRTARAAARARESV